MDELDELLESIDFDDKDDQKNEENDDLKSISKNENENESKKSKEIDEEYIKRFENNFNNVITTALGKRITNKPDYSENFKEVIAATRTFIKNSFAIKKEIKILREELKELKKEAKEEGVSVSNAEKAIRELIKEFKESSEDSKTIEELKRFIKNEEELYLKVVEEAS